MEPPRSRFGPAGASAVSLRLANRTGDPQFVSVAATCLGLPGGRSAPLLRASRVQRKISVAGGAQRQAGLGCPAGTVAAGAGFAISGPALQVRESTRSVNRFSFTVENDSARARPAVLYGTCLTLVRPSGLASGAAQRPRDHFDDALAARRSGGQRGVPAGLVRPGHGLFAARLRHALGDGGGTRRRPLVADEPGVQAAAPGPAARLRPRSVGSLAPSDGRQ